VIVEPAVVQLIGHAGAGKYTVAKELAARRPGPDDRWVVVDNHYVNNPIFGVLDLDGVKPLDPSVWGHVAKVRAAVLDTIRTLSPPSWSFVFTNVLIAGQKGDEAAPVELAKLAEARGASFVPVVLRCEVDELVRRVVSPGRATRLKWRDPDGVRAVATSTSLVVPDHANLLELDVTAMDPSDTADRILEHVEGQAVAASNER
jgi:hypothetical protein